MNTAKQYYSASTDLRSEVGCHRLEELQSEKQSAFETIQEHGVEKLYVELRDGWRQCGFPGQVQ